MEEIVYWVKTKRAPCLYRYDTANKGSDEQSSKDKPSPKKTNDQASPKKRKKRKLSIFDDSESEKNEKNIYFENATQPVPQETVISSCKDSIISENEANVKGPLNLKSIKIRKIDTKKTTPKQNKISNAGGKRTLRSLGKIQNLDSSLESGLFSGETKNKQSSVSKSISKKSVDKYILSDVPKAGSLKIEKKKPVKGVFDDISDVSGCTANYIRSTKQSSLSNKLNKSKKNNKQLIKESQDSGKKSTEVKICADISAIKNEPVNCNSDAYNILNLISKEEPKHVNGNIKLDKPVSMLKCSGSKSKEKAGLKSKKGKLNDTSMQLKRSAGSPYFTRSKVGTYDEFFKTDNTSTPIKSSVGNNRKQISRAKAKPSTLVMDNDGASSRGSLNAEVTRKQYKTVTKNGSIVNNNKDKSASAVVRDKSGFAQCFSESDDELPQRKFFA